MKVIFDPRKLSTEQLDFVIKKLDYVSAAPDADGCRKFKPAARHGDQNKYGYMKLRSDISEIFGNKKRNYDASKLLYHVHNNIVWMSDSYAERECSHLCGFGLCMTIAHLIVEPHGINCGRRDHHEFQYCDNKHNGYAMCLLKSVEPNYDPWHPDTE